MYRSQRIRRAVVELPLDSRYRRTLLLRFFAWCYRHLNEGGIPDALFAEDFELHQTAAFIDTAGTFTGRDALGAVLEELSTAFDEFTFEPISFAELDDRRLLLLVRFRAVGRGSGLELDRVIGHDFHFSGEGNATRLDVYWEEREALRAAGLVPTSRPAAEPRPE